MKDDLLEPIACVDWTIAQLPAFEERVQTWLDDNFELRWVDQPAPATHDTLIVRQLNPLPLEFSVAVGAYVNTIRSALDILAVAIGKREMVLNPDNIYFPVAANAADFAARNYKGSEFVRQLSRDSSAIIEKFQPYYGGYECIWATHDLDITRKHKRLLEVYTRPAKWHVRGWGMNFRDNWLPAEPGLIEPGKGETPLGQFLKGADKPEAHATLQIVFTQGTALPGRPVIGTIRGLALGVKAVITAFDF